MVLQLHHVPNLQYESGLREWSSLCANAPVPLPGLQPPCVIASSCTWDIAIAQYVLRQRTTFTSHCRGMHPVQATAGHLTDCAVFLLGGALLRAMGLFGEPEAEARPSMSDCMGWHALSSLPPTPPQVGLRFVNWLTAPALLAQALHRCSTPAFQDITHVS